MQTAPPSGQNDVGIPPVSTSSLPTSSSSVPPNPTEPNQTQIPTMDQMKENIEKVPTPPNSIAPPGITTSTQPDENQPMTDSVAPPEPPPPNPLPQGGTPGLETNESNPNNEPTETE